MSGDQPAAPCGDFTSCQPMPGLTKREWFAGMALQGIAYAYADIKGDVNKLTPPPDFERFLAEGAFSIADAMLAESEKK